MPPNYFAFSRTACGLRVRKQPGSSVLAPMLTDDVTTVEFYIFMTNMFCFPFQPMLPDV
jgi:hypothetical protein